jgi:predicted secreted protein
MATLERLQPTAAMEARYLERAEMIVALQETLKEVRLARTLCQPVAKGSADEAAEHLRDVIYDLKQQTRAFEAMYGTGYRQ